MSGKLYDTTKDWSQAHDLAKQMPEKVAELKRLFDLEASKYNVFPLDDRKAERTNPDIAGRPQVAHGSTQLLFSGMRPAWREHGDQHQEQVALGYRGGRDPAVRRQGRDRCSRRPHGRLESLRT
jgi:hypothetical protein